MPVFMWWHSRRRMNRWRDQVAYECLAFEPHKIIHTKVHTHEVPNRRVLCKEAGDTPEI